MGRALPRSHRTRHTGASALPGVPFLSEQTLNRQLQSQAPPCSPRPVVQQSHLPTARLRQRRASLVGPHLSVPRDHKAGLSRPTPGKPTPSAWACVRGQPRGDLVLQPTCRH